MLYYRLYFMDRFSGHIDHFREFEAEDDSAAIEIAERLGERRGDGIVEPPPQAEALGRAGRHSGLTTAKQELNRSKHRFSGRATP